MSLVTAQYELELNPTFCRQPSLNPQHFRKRFFVLSGIRGVARSNSRTHSRRSHIAVRERRHLTPQRNGRCGGRCARKRRTRGARHRAETRRHGRSVWCQTTQSCAKDVGRPGSVGRAPAPTLTMRLACSHSEIFRSWRESAEKFGFS